MQCTRRSILRYTSCGKSLYSSTLKRRYASTTPTVTRLTIDVKPVSTTTITASSSISVDAESLPLELAHTEKLQSIKKLQVLPPSLQYVRDLMDRYPDHVVLTQMGSFYELYFEQATQFAPQLNIALTTRTYSHGKVPFAGFPVQQLGRHLRVLVDGYGYSVTIAEQFQKDGVADNDTTSKFYRRVTRIVTPGTFIDEAFENFQENSYLLNIQFPEKCMKRIADIHLKVGLCWCDLSTGEIFVQEVQLQDLVSAITRIKPKEILLDESLNSLNIESGEWFPELVELKKYLINYQKVPSVYRTLDTFNNLIAHNNLEQIDSLLKIQYQSFTQKELAALRNILVYINDHLPDLPTNLQIPQSQLITSIMQIDSRTSRALELHSTIRDDSKRGSLLSCIRRTATSAGARLLAQWLAAPSMDLHEIRNRQKIVSFLKDNTIILDKLTSQLKDVDDILRILQKFNFKQGRANDLIQLAKSLKAATQIGKILKRSASQKDYRGMKYLENIISGLNFKEALVDEVLDCLAEDVAAANNDVEDLNTINSENEAANNWIVNPSSHEDLLKLHESYDKLVKEKQLLEQKYHKIFIKECDARSITLKQRSNNEYALHIVGSSSSLKKIDEYLFDNAHYTISQRSSQTRWVYDELWTSLAYRMELALIKIKQKEMNIIDSFRSSFLQHTNKIRKLANTLAYLDVLSSFSVLAIEKNLIKPHIDKSKKLSIIGGRHIMVEDGLALKSLETFVTNDCNIDCGDLWVITGPNMGGKSTFLRQNAIIVILAQIGCFVPCQEAHIGLVDKIFSRVGSADDLYNEMSTFMVEMIETSFILHGATDRSLAILDEIGRGTSGREGTAIAYATLKHLVNNNRSRSLFATHFGPELGELINAKDSALVDKVKFFQSGIIDMPGQFAYNYRLKPGISVTSDALKVAIKAGFPDQALKDAIRIMQAV